MKTMPGKMEEEVDEMELEGRRGENWEYEGRTVKWDVTG